MEELNKQIDYLARKCRHLGLKLTKQRVEIYTELANAKDHPSAETLHKRLQPRMPNLSVDTVYRTLSTFCEYGLALKLLTAESQARFEGNLTPHHHVICNQCRQIEDFEDEFQNGAASKKLADWGQVITQHIVIYGLCHNCMNKQRAVQPERVFADVVA